MENVSNPALLEDLRIHIGPLLLGVLIHALLSGGVLVQVFHFFSWAQGDSYKLKGLVFFLGITTFTAAIVNQVYLWQLFIDGFGNYPLMFGRDLHTAAVSFVVLTIHESTAQAFFSFRLWRLARSIPLAVATVACIALCFTSTIAAISVINSNDESDWKYVEALLETASWAAVATDTMICGAFAIKLRRMQTGFNTNTDAIVQKVIRTSLAMTLGTGSLALAGAIAVRVQGPVANVSAVSSCGVLPVLTKVSPRQYQRFFAYLKAPLYVASIMYTLNSRRQLRETNSALTGPTALPRATLIATKMEGVTVHSPQMNMMPDNIEIPVYLGTLGAEETTPSRGGTSVASEKDSSDQTEKVELPPMSLP